MDERVSETAPHNSNGNKAFTGNCPGVRRKPVGRRAGRAIAHQEALSAMSEMLAGIFPELPEWFNALPDRRNQILCKYTAAHIWFQPLLMFLTRAGSRNAFDISRNSGNMPINMGIFCGQPASDDRFDEHPTVTCSDNVDRHVDSVAPEDVAEIPVKMIRKLMMRGMFNSCRMLNTWHVLVVDGTVQEKCRKGFEKDGKTMSNGSKQYARYRYVLQCGILGPGGKLLPLMHETVDMHNPATEKEDCELEAFMRLAARIKKAFPRTPFCIVGDALYACERVVCLCEENEWRYVLTLKEGRQPTLWGETLELFGLAPQNHATVLHAPDGEKPEYRDFRWVEDLKLGDKHRCAVILEGVCGTQACSLYAWITNFRQLDKSRVLTISNVAGRERHRIEDLFNAQKNNGVGLEHVFCAKPQAAKNYYTIMQVAEIIWQLFFWGHCWRLFEWARKTTQKGIARAIGEGLRHCRINLNVRPIGQLRFVT